MRNMVSCRNVAHWAKNLSQICVQRLHLEDSSSTAHGGNKGLWWSGQQLPGSCEEEVTLATVLRTVLPLCCWLNETTQYGNPVWVGAGRRKQTRCSPDHFHPSSRPLNVATFKGQLPSKRRFVFCSQQAQTSKGLAISMLVSLCPIPAYVSRHHQAALLKGHNRAGNNLESLQVKGERPELHSDKNRC